MNYTVGPLLTDGSRAAAYLVGQATHQESFFGIEATGSAVEFRGSYHCRVADGLIAEDWDVFDLSTPLLRVGGVIAQP
jgi:predicted ester cyclase